MDFASLTIEYKPMNQLIGQTFRSRYQIQSLLGRQIGRRTFLATDLSTQSPVVVKLLLFGPDFTWDDLKLFEREAKTLQSLDHPAIPKYLDYFDVNTELGKGFALVQSYIDATSLEAAVQAGRTFSEAELVEIAEQLLSILVYLHGQMPPVIHRDIKPSNILINNRTGHHVGELYLVDFGSVQTVADQSNGTITIVGSYGYIPLEQFAGQTAPASDLYSLGMTLIYLITGTHPANLAQANGQVEFESNSISRKFSKWLEKMTHSHLSRRFDSAQSALTALKSEDGSYGFHLDFDPARSKIKLFRDQDSIKIITYKSLSIEGCVGCGTYVLAAIVGLLFGFNALIVSFFIATIIVGSAIPITNKPEIIITIDKRKDINQITQKSLFFSQTKSSRIEDINLLSYSPGYTFDRYIDSSGKVVMGGKVVVAPKLSIFTHDTEYQISHSNAVEAELWWLGQELSDFLELDLTVIYPTPKVPPEQTCGCGC
jgi:serine/threonine protein kinase